MDTPNIEFVTIMVNLFTTAERQAWGSTFYHADKAGWIDHDLDTKVLHR